MYYINATPTENGNYGNPQSGPVDGMIALPDELLADYISCMGFVILTLDGDTVTALSINQTAYDAYQEKHPDRPDVPRATQNYEPREYITVDGTLCKVVLPIFAGAQITPGTNVEPTTIEAEMSNLNKEEN